MFLYKILWKNCFWVFRDHFLYQNLPQKRYSPFFEILSLTFYDKFVFRRQQQDVDDRQPK